MGDEVSLRWLASRQGPVDADQLAKIREWIDADWESHDIDKDAVRLINRLVETLEGKSK